ncbi:hypothetical protein GA0111570_107131 [Raineyella antarctica]|uniref:Uncharacterized protein n=1 Tax=Raineyella antarctica TaxID=1577474 RepID=A0A1G6H8H6_9ACTN|nr:hypothetical protein [Raineyella antarctica]SDB90589.1 hypothetical protein GA0111570_107131 [Raineyella antarctica]
MAEIQQAVVGWAPTSNGLGVLGASPGWPLVDGQPWLPDQARTFLPRGSDAEVMRGTEPPGGLEAHPTAYGTILVSKVYLGRVGRPGTFTAHCVLDPSGRQGATDLLDLARDGVLRLREEQPDAEALPALQLTARRTQPLPGDVAPDLLAVLIARLADRTPLLLRARDRMTAIDTFAALARALPRRVGADMWWSSFVAHPYDPAETAGPGVGVVVAPFSVTDDFGASTGPATLVDLDAGPPTAPERARALCRSYLDHPERYGDAADVDEFIARLDALTLDPAAPVDDRALDLLAGDVGPVVFARLITGERGMTRLAEVVRAGRRLPYRALWSAVPELPAQMYAWFGPVQGDQDVQVRAQHVICSTMDTRNLARLVARPLAADVADFRPVIADRKLAGSLAGLGVPLDAYEWRVLTEEWGPVVTAAVVGWLEGWTHAPADLARLAADRAGFVAGLDAALAAVAAPAADVRDRLAGWRELPVEEWIDVLLECRNVPAGTPLAALGRLDRGGVRQVLRRDWPRLAGQAGIPAVVAEELRVRGLGF